jgi:hypothetical protein
VKDGPFLRALGSGFGVFGFGLNVILRVAPMIGWQPSYLTALTLLIFGFVCMAGGALIVVATAIPSDGAINTIFSRYWKPIGFWLVGVLAFVFISWQSITIYRFQTSLQKLQGRLVFEWPSLTVKKKLALSQALRDIGSRSRRPYYFQVQCGDENCVALARDIGDAAKAAGWAGPPNALISLWLNSDSPYEIELYGTCDTEESNQEIQKAFTVLLIVIRVASHRRRQQLRQH